MDWELLTIVGLSAAATAVLSAVAGLGGGLVLLVVLLQFLDPIDAIPVHGAIQIASNGSRAWLLRSHIEWRIVRFHAVLLVPGGLIGLQFVDRLPKAGMRALIGAFALVATWCPSVLAPRTRRGKSDPAEPQEPLPPRTFLAVGLAHGTINMPLGATGPMIAPFFRAALADRREVVSTFAASQVIGHAVKIALFGLVGFSFQAHWPTIAIGAAGVVAGTWVGTRLLHQLSEKAFVVLFRATVTLAALRLLMDALRSVL